MLKLKHFLIGLLCFVCGVKIQAQNKNNSLDSFLIVARQTKNDSSQIRMYNKIAFGYIFNDTKKAIAVIKEGKQLANDVGFNFGLAELTNTQGVFMDVTGKSDSAKYYFEKALDLSRKHSFKYIESMCVNNLGMFNWNTGDFESALAYFFQALKMNEDANNEKSTGIALNNIGLIYQDMNLSEKALAYHQKALKVREKYNLENEQIASLNNIGINFKDLGRVDEAIAIYKRGLDLAKRKNNLIERFKLLDNLANAYYKKGDANLALETCLKALDKPLDFDAEEKREWSSLNNIATLYNEIGKPKMALVYLNKGFNLIKKYPEIQLAASNLYLTRAESNYMLRNFKQARKDKKKFVVLKDSIFSESNAKAIAALEIKYETEKKEKEILVQRTELAEQNLIIQKKNFQLYGLIALVLVLGFLGYLFYNQQKLKNIQLQKETELKDALMKIETQNRLQEQRLRISRDLHDNIGAQLTFIISSIDNLKYGFTLPKELQTRLESINQFTSGTTYELRDTIWAMNKSEITFEDLQTRISNFIDKAKISSEGIQFNFKVDKSLSEEIVFTSVQGMNVYRIIQESINNSIKYASAKHIKVDITKQNKTLAIKIVDNGKGFNTKEVELRNGINNMKKRAMDLNAEFQLNSKENSGTTIQLQIPIHM
ncbi:tetratricopeptide repeat-containing sensor histidine kinase [Lacinutrix jangbogonensis]|uniref:tetratricopeptide repeat-containing sensor histidine kinase n=1 Tax=Lacinutrix jangbogonensis TaxID=1469557 RepID=UPI00069095A0|nr:tetratricopeptide repeat protein [Lacinutrix jangbogonensis]